MNRGHVSTSSKMICIWCGKVTYTYIDFNEGISVNVPCCREHENEVRKFDRIMTAHLRLIKAELKSSENYGLNDERRC